MLKLEELRNTGKSTEKQSILIKDANGDFKSQGYGNKGSMHFPGLYRIHLDLEWRN